MVQPSADEKLTLCLEFILERLQGHQKKCTSQGGQSGSQPPLFVGINGVQGAGKTTLVTALLERLNGPPHHTRSIAFSIDDLYLPHAQLVELAAAHPDNPLVQHRGEPSTHDVSLGVSLFERLSRGEADVKVPSYDKSLNGGKGDRLPESEWQIVNRTGDGDKLAVVLFEGWCVGFRALGNDDLSASAELEEKHSESRRHAQMLGDEDFRIKGRLCSQSLKHVSFINDALRQYDVLTNRLDAFIAIDAEDTDYVYDWRLEQEAALRASRGSGMSDEQVVRFVNGYYPAYELYLDGLRRGALRHEEHGAGQQLHLIVDNNRKLKSSRTI